MLHVASVCTPCCILLDVVACCCSKFETGQTFQPTSPNISFVPWSPKCSATMLDSFAHLFQHCWGHACALHMDCKVLWVVSFPWCTAGPNMVGSCCIRLYTTAKMHRTTLNIVGATMFGNCCVRLRIALPALLIDVRHSITIFFKSNAPALLPWYSIAYSPETCSSLIILHQNNIKFYTCANPC